MIHVLSNVHFHRECRNAIVCGDDGCVWKGLYSCNRATWQAYLCPRQTLALFTKRLPGLESTGCCFPTNNSEHNDGIYHRASNTAG